MEGWTPILYWVSKRSFILSQSKVNLLLAPFGKFIRIWCSVCPSLCLSNNLSVHSCESISMYHSTRLSKLPASFLSVCLFICRSVYHSVYPLFAYQSLCSSVCLSACLSLHLHIWLSLCLSPVCLPICVFKCPSICPSICLSISLFLHNYLSIYLSVCCTSSKLSACSTYVCMTVCMPGILTINICCRIYIAVQKLS